MKQINKHIILTTQDVQKSVQEDLWDVIEPIFYSGDIYRDYARYEQSLANFSREQRLLFAMNWMISEVYNGGFNQFFDNSTGIVWADAYAGFQIIGDEETVNILDEVRQWWGGEPSTEREERQERLSTLWENDEADKAIDKLGQCFYSDETETQRNEKLCLWVSANADKFTFDGTVLAYE